MSDNRNSRKKNIPKVLSPSTNSSEPMEDEPIVETSIRKYQDDSDYDEAFKNLLRPIESIAKKNYCEPLQYDLLKELDSYLNHLKESSDGGSSVFVEAALMFQNVILLYQKRVDQLVDVMQKLIGKFRAYRINQTENISDDIENEDGNKKKKKEKKIKFYPSFDPLKGQIFGTLKNFDCKVINLSKRPTVPRIVLNSNIKVENKYSKILPYICIGNGENIGKKYDFMVNYPLNRDLAVNEEFDCPTKEEKKCETSLNFQKNTDLFPMNLMDVDGIDSNDVIPSTPDPVIFDQTVTDEVCVTNAMAANPPNILNVSQIPPKIDDNDWALVLNNDKETNFNEKPLTEKKIPKKEDTGVWLPAYTFAELRGQLLRLKSGLSADPIFRKLVRKAYDIQRSDVKKINKRIAEEKKQFNWHDEEMEKRLQNGEEPGFKGFDSPVYPGEFDDNFENAMEREQSPGIPEENFELYKKNLQMHDQNQEKIMNEQLEMVKRVQIWHDNLRPILEEEEKRISFDIHEYGTRILNSFGSKGEQKPFQELVGGCEQEEVARYFLSTLMMTNTYNLKIIKSRDETNREIKIELLKKERHHEELQVNIGNQVNQEPE